MIKFNIYNTVIESDDCHTLSMYVLVPVEELEDVAAYVVFEEAVENFSTYPVGCFYIGDDRRLYPVYNKRERLVLDEELGYNYGAIEASGDINRILYDIEQSTVSGYVVKNVLKFISDNSVEVDESVYKSYTDYVEMLEDERNDIDDY